MSIFLVYKYVILKLYSSSILIGIYDSKNKAILGIQEYIEINNLQNLDKYDKSCLKDLNTTQGRIYNFAIEVNKINNLI